MTKTARTLLLTLRRDDGANVYAIALAGVCAFILLVFFVQTLEVSIAHGQALRAKQNLGPRTAAAQFLAADVQVSDSSPEAAEP